MGVVTLSQTERNLPTTVNVAARDFKHLAGWSFVQIGPIPLNVTMPIRRIGGKNSPQALADEVFGTHTGRQKRSRRRAAPSRPHARARTMPPSRDRGFTNYLSLRDVCRVSPSRFRLGAGLPLSATALVPAVLLPTHL
jgi:hypothetical protein